LITPPPSPDPRTGEGEERVTENVMNEFLLGFTVTVLARRGRGAPKIAAVAG
jgi:hypothetical protein